MVTAPVLAAALHALYVLRVGGDYMHGRLLLPSLFAALLPVAVIQLPIGGRDGPSREILIVGMPIVAWSVACLLFLRVPYLGRAGPDGIEDGRGFMVRITRVTNPIVLSDFDASDFSQDGYALRRIVGSGQHRLLIDRKPFCPDVSVRRAADCEEVLPQEQWYPLAQEVDAGITMAAVRKNIGVTGYAGGSEIFLIDRHGLSDPLAARLRLTVRRKLGHEKALPNPWVVARFADPTALAAADADVVAARAALTCGSLAELRRAVEEPLTPRRFMRNITLAWQLYRLRIPSDPQEAQHELCGSGAGG